MFSFLLGIFIYAVLVRCVLLGIYKLEPNERAVKTAFGRARRLRGRTTAEAPFWEDLRPTERDRYEYPLVEVIKSGLHFKLPWEEVHKVSVATETINMALDLEDPRANSGGTVLDAVTQDQLNIGLRGQIRFRASERNLYPFLFGVKSPVVHVMAYFISILRERIANFTARPTEGEGGENALIEGVSINDLRKNLRELNDLMASECRSAEARYGICLDASLITELDSPEEVESALAAINTAHNTVSSQISLARADADQKIVQSRRAVEIQTLRAQAEVEPLVALAQQLQVLRTSEGSLSLFVRNVRLGLLKKAKRVILPHSLVQGGSK